MLDNFLAALRQDRPGALAGGVSLFTGPAAPATSPMAQWVLSQFLQTSPLATREYLRLAMQVSMRPVLRALQLPTLLVHGTQDALNPLASTGTAIAREIPGSRLVTVDGAPHGLPVTHHQPLTAELLAFLSGTPNA